MSALERLLDDPVLVGRRARPVALDLFACEGGMSVGLDRAGWEVWAVERDRLHARRNPHSWHVGDWREGLDLALATGRVRYVHASPPCQGYSATRELAVAQGRTRDAGRAVDLLPEVLEVLEGLGLPYTVENVERSPLRRDVVLCGSSFGLAVKRHRVFQSNVPLPDAPECAHHTFPLDPVSGKPRPWGVYGSWRDSIPSGGRTATSGAHARELLGIEWPMTDRGTREALPPVYGEWIGAAVLEAAAVSA